MKTTKAKTSNRRPPLNKWVRDYLLSRSMHEIIMDYDSVRLVQRVAKVLAANSPFLNILKAKRRRFPKTDSLMRSVFPAGYPKGSL